MKPEFVFIKCNELTPEGEVSDLLKLRLDYAIDICHNEYPGIDVIVTGRHGIIDKEFVETTGRTEAKVMKDYLESHGVTKINAMSEGTNSFEVLYATRKVIQLAGWKQGILITNQEHI